MARAPGRGPGGAQASFDFRGARNNAAGRMLTVTLTNDLDGTEECRPPSGRAAIVNDLRSSPVTVTATWSI